jgi:tetratricopeptide (TPR) repeat protein
VWLLECLSVRLQAVIFLLSLFFAAVCAPAEVIHLRNGRTIWADSVRENGHHLEYDVGDNSYAIPKALVERVDAGGVRPTYASSGGGSKEAVDLPSLPTSESLKGEGDLLNKVVREGHVDSDALEAIGSKENPELAATAYFIAGKHEFERGDTTHARRYFETALGFRPTNSTILSYYAILLVRTGNAAQALPYADRAARAAPDSADALTVLGYVQTSCDRTREAIQSWKKSLKLRPDPAVEQMLAKAQREDTAEAAFSERDSSHFTLHFEGSQTSDSFRRDILATLDSEYDDLVRELGISPRNNISVFLFTQQTFFDVTHAPSWSGAVNDGKLRIPINGLTSVTPELARVLKHELAHSFINQASGGRCPMWLHEGIAQLVEPKSIDANGRRLAELFKAQHEIPFNVLEGSFTRFSTLEAMLAYDESLAAAQYISETYGTSDLQRILERMGQGSSAEAALRATIHSNYSDLELEVGKFLAGKYGN